MTTGAEVGGMAHDMEVVRGRAAGWRRPRSATASVGALVVAASALAFSTAGLFTRLIAVDVWTMLFWRGLSGGALILACVVWRYRAAAPAAFVAIGSAGLTVAACSTVGTICFIGALRMTSVADVTILYATAPFIAAALTWVSLREVPSVATLLASVLALGGVAIMGWGALSGGHLAGDALALAMTALMALMMVVIRRHRHVSMLPAACLSAFACALLVAPLARPATAGATDLALLMLFGTTQFGLGLLLLTVGSRMIPPARASLLGNLELPLAPLWVWLAFAEAPAAATIAGGSIVCAAVLLDLMTHQALNDAPA